MFEYGPITKSQAKLHTKYVPFSQFEELEPFSRLGIHDRGILIDWKWVIQLTLTYFEFDPMYRDIWDTLTYPYASVKELYEAYIYLVKYLEENGFDDEPLVLRNLKSIIEHLKYILYPETIPWHLRPGAPFSLNHQPTFPIPFGIPKNGPIQAPRPQTSKPIYHVKFPIRKQPTMSAFDPASGKNPFGPSK